MVEWERRYRKHSDEEKPAKAVQGKFSVFANNPSCRILLWFWGDSLFFHFFLYRDQCLSVLTQKSHPSSS